MQTSRLEPPAYHINQQVWAQSSLHSWHNLEYGPQIMANVETIIKEKMLKPYMRAYFNHELSADGKSCLQIPNNLKAFFHKTILASSYFDELNDLNTPSTFLGYPLEFTDKDSNTIIFQLSTKDTLREIELFGLYT